MKASNSRLDRLNRRHFIGGASAASLAALAPGFAQQSHAQSDAASALNLHIELTPPTLWPPTATDRSSAMVFELVYSPLLRSDEQYVPQPELAESLTISDDAKTFTFTLREGTTWHDGEPVTADDVAYTFTLHLTASVGSLNYTNLAGIVGAQEFYDGTADAVEGIEVIDDRTITFTLIEPNAGFLPVFTGIWILPQHIFGDIAPDQLNSAPAAQTPVGTGPFKFVQYATNQYYEFDANEQFYGGAPKIPKVFMRIAPADVALVLVQNGEVDFIADLPPADIETIQDVEHLEVLTTTNEFWWWFASANRAKEYLNDKRVLQALVHALDRQGYIDSVLRGQGAVLNHLVGPAWAQAPEDQINLYPYDPERGRALLEEAGWDFDRVVKLAYYPGNESRDQIPAIAQQQWKEIGFQVEVESMDVARYVEMARNGEQELSITGGGPGPDPNGLRIQFHSASVYPQGNNLGSYQNARVDELFDIGQVTTDQAERAAIYQEMDVILNDELPWQPICVPNYVSVINRRISGVTYNPNIGRYWRIHEWEITG